MFDTALTIAATHPTLTGLGEHGPYYGPGPHLWFLIVPLFWLVVAIVVFAVFGRRWSRRAAERREFYREHWQSEAQSAAEKVLAERFARGDIDEVEFRARLEVLRAATLRTGPGAAPGFGPGAGFGHGGPGMPPRP